MKPKESGRKGSCEKDIVSKSSGAARREGGTCPRAQGLGVHQHIFCILLKTRFKQKVKPKDASKCVFFGKKNCKNRLSIFQ